MGITEANWMEFATRSYTFVEQLVPEKDRTRLCERAIELSKTANIVADSLVPGTPAVSADFGMEDLLESLVPRIEQITQRPLFPTYSYFRVYKNGDALGRHTDRPACEFSVSLNLGYGAPASWPIWIQGPLGASSIAMEPGDAVVYRGIECPHWRETFEGDFVAQVFLHYVDQHGPHAEWKFDKRPRLGTMPKGIKLSKHLRPVRFDGLLEFNSGQSIRLNPLRTVVLKRLEFNSDVPDIVQDIMMQFRLSQLEAETAVTQFIFKLEEKHLLTIRR